MFCRDMKGSNALFEFVRGESGRFLQTISYAGVIRNS